MGLLFQKVAMGWWPWFEFDVNSQVSLVSEYTQGIWTLKKCWLWAAELLWLTPTFLAISSESPYNLLQTSSHKHHSIGFHSRRFPPFSWNSLPEPPHPFLWLPSVCQSHMPVIHMALSSPPCPPADWIPSLARVFQTQHFTISPLGLLPGTQATQLGLILDSFFCPSHQNHLN